MDISQAPQEITNGELLHSKEPKPFKEIDEEEYVDTTVGKLPRGKKSYTPEELCQILTPEELYQTFTPKELLHMFKPGGLRQILPWDLYSTLYITLDLGTRERGRNGGHYQRNEGNHETGRNGSCYERNEGNLERGKEKSSC